MPRGKLLFAVLTFFAAVFTCGAQSLPMEVEVSLPGAVVRAENAPEGSGRESVVTVTPKGDTKPSVKGGTYSLGMHRCKGLFNGYIGNDVNPVVAILLDDGTLRTYSPASELFTVPLIGFEKIASFENGRAELPGASYVDENGVTRHETYGTIYAIDSLGVRHEIPRANPWTLELQGKDPSPFVIVLNGDFSMRVDYNVPVEGRFSKYGTYSMDYKKHLCTCILDGEKSEFYLKRVISDSGEQTYTLTPMKGLLFGAPGYGVGTIFFPTEKWAAR